jgi:phospholipid/cholesterol/gamma-HCH transport system substrate-binding protein
VTRRLAPVAAVTAAALLGLTGCQFNGAASLPLPGGEATGSNAYEVSIEFADVLDLVPQSSVKVDDVTVGSVSKITLADGGGYKALVTVRLKDDVVLPGNARASLRQTSLLGEKFVSLDRPTAEAAVGRLHDKDLIPLSRTSRNAEIEEVLATLSLVLNGGALEQIKTINVELTKALKGRESNVKDVLTQLDTFVGGLDKQKADIVRALDSLDRLTARLAAQRQTLAVALRDIPGGVQVLADQRAQLTQVLTGLDRLGKVSTTIIRASKQNTVADLKALEPILGQLNAAGSNLPKALELLTTYPFPRTIDNGIFGDDANLFATADVDLRTILGNVVAPPPVAVAGRGPSGARTVPRVPTILPTLPPLPGLPGLPDVPVVPVPTAVPPVPGAPGVPGVPVPGTGGGLPGLSAGQSGDLFGLLTGGLS